MHPENAIIKSIIYRLFGLVRSRNIFQINAFLKIINARGPALVHRKIITYN